MVGTGQTCSESESWKAGEEPTFAAAIIELFCLLPHAASKFLDELVTSTIGSTPWPI
ncbi:hypothetical protein CCACVL1_16347 [Corchorus capsularis]|uniref:Uncharacterized protein n=1 Tax=Corchorus capsularis TaxID=210143 RepID=A0A1R3HXM8_COCAP|nr:hypothetical protein CCACVL1_16347 [Corchorus capsularis]